MNFFKIIQMLFSLLPIIHAAVDQIEDLFPQGGNGAQKLTLVKNVIESAMKMVDTGSVTFSTLWPAISSIVAGIVSLKNKITEKEIPNAQNVQPVLTK